MTFESEKAARKAINYDGHKFYNRKLKVTKAEKKEEIEEKRLKGDDFAKEWIDKGADLEEEVKKDFKERRDYRDKDRRRSRSRSGDRRKSRDWE